MTKSDKYDRITTSTKEEKKLEERAAKASKEQKKLEERDAKASEEQKKIEARKPSEHKGRLEYRRT